MCPIPVRPPLIFVRYYAGPTKKDLRMQPGAGSIGLLYTCVFFPFPGWQKQQTSDPHLFGRLLYHLVRYILFIHERPRRPEGRSRNPMQVVVQRGH